MPRTRKLKDEEVEVERVNVVSTDERWNEYLLSDGTVMRVKFVITSVDKATEKMTPDGKPTYFFDHIIATDVDPKGDA